MEETLLQWISQYGYQGIFFLLMFGIIGLPIPDEVLLTFSGYLVFKGQLALAPTIDSAFLGSICGVSVSYIIGRTGGSFLARKYDRWFHITQEKIDRVHEWLEHVGKWGLFIGYFITEDSPNVEVLHVIQKACNASVACNTFFLADSRPEHYPPRRKFPLCLHNME
ncbi:MAG: DedA family protein [Syntrophobacteraceae bacterium]